MSEIRRGDTRPYHHGDLRRALIDAALDLVTEEQDWTFSLREVARRAGVSHNAPYNHFSEKRDLLGAVAAAGFETLRERMQGAALRAGDPRAAFIASGKAYVKMGVENPALYRLMFGPALAAANGPAGRNLEGEADRPAEARAAGARAKAVLDEIILRGAETGAFAVSPDNKDNKKERAIASLSAWSAVHGLTMLIIDDLAAQDLAIDTLVTRVLHIMLEGLVPRRGQ
ncbi:MAG TPA: WHG domain-containing protein [Methylovirgula sp.]|nr:WHG domain-containing protein [Methylovirgula sp.]